MNSQQGPNKHIIALITFVALIPLVFYIPLWVETYFAATRLTNVILSLTIIVPIVSYLVLPACIQLITLSRKAG